MKVNLFQIQEHDFKAMLEQFGVIVKLNNIDTSVLVTNKPINELDDKFISAIAELKRGDHVVLQDRDYYVINQITTKRYQSYKAIIRCAEHYIRFNLSVKDGSTYSEYDVKEIPCIISTATDFELETGRQLMIAEGALAIYIQDNATTRAIYSSFTDPYRKHDIFIENRQYEYRGFDFISSGLVRINVKVTSTGNVEDGINWGISTTHGDWNGFIEKSFYDLKIV
ncbi:hypothetical protein GCM10008018_66160 [Paenibacillus marchantiophytorum]|uniref:Uncharacterized protein n=1 Tax=Paenibacillus marchantiophytorum TaxID=1619310 RepID=A0ABQ1FG62_9BACL|nr:hypothetical protein [Paenibacillus marchantiophytorum]GGA11878.1 hypothetical protein GCM10008018_66160 [Paenibacillus marchantiophytorum]